MDVIACVVLLWLVPGLGAGQGNNLDINGTPGGEFFIMFEVNVFKK